MKGTILIVDDDLEMLHMMPKLFPDFRVLTADRGAKGLELLDRESPHVVLLDISMPGMSGIEVLREVRKLRPDLKILMLTGELELEKAKETLTLGASAYITKPFDLQRLRLEIERHLPAGAPPDEPDRPPWRTAR